MRPSEPSFILFLRGVTLLAFLIVVPGIAICWHHLPKDLWYPASSKREPRYFPKDSGDGDGRQQTVDNREGLSENPVAISHPPSVAPLPAIQQVSWEQPVHDFTALEQRLKALGVTHYQLKKWGDRGELFHFSCTVTPSKPLAYEKYFQAIDTDAETVMRSVIANIEQWKSGN